jgi:hypothetical protein
MEFEASLLKALEGILTVLEEEILAVLLEDKWIPRPSLLPFMIVRIVTVIIPCP